MQNSKLENINIQQKCVVVITKPKYRINNVFSWIVQNVKDGKLTRQSTISDIYKLKQELADETQLRLNRFIFDNSNKKKGVLFDPFPNCIETPYYIIGDNFNTVNFSATNYIQNKLYSNDRIVSCDVTQATDTAWTCNVVLNNTDDLYTLDNEYYYNSKNGYANTNFGKYILNQENKCVIEPNDEIQVFMNNWKGNFNSVFTGLVTSVTISDDGLNKAVNLSCDDMFKKLTWTYKVVKASFDSEEAFGTSISEYEQNYADKSWEDVLKTVLGSALCDIYKRDIFLLEATKSYVLNKEGDRNVSLSKIIEKEINKYIEIEEVPKELQKENDSSKTLRIIGYKATIDYQKIAKGNIEQTGQVDIVATTASTNNGETFITGEKVVVQNENNNVLTDYKDGDIAFKISGMEQPAWAWTINSGSFDFLFSTFKRNDEFVKEIASIVSYEVFADVNGIVLFRPQNLVLPRKVDFKNKEFTKEYNDYLDNYLVLPDKEEEYFTSFKTTADDSAIVTQVQVNGSFRENNTTYPEILKAKSYAPLQYINQYGIRMTSPLSRVGLKTPDMCKRYGDLFLWRQNKNYELGSASCILNSDYTVGMPILINRQLAVWYIKRVTHSFSAGNICTTELTLGYKRNPLCYRKDLQTFLSSSLEKGKISQTQYDKIKDNAPYLTWGILDLKYANSMPIAQTTQIVSTTGTIQGEQIVIGNSRNIITGTGTKYNPIDKKQYLLVWEPIPVELYDDIMEYNSQSEGSKSNKSRDIKVKSTLATKAKGTQDLIKFIKPDIDAGAGVPNAYDINISNSTTIKKEQKEAILTTDAVIQKDTIVDPTEFLKDNFEKMSEKQIQVLPIQNLQQFMVPAMKPISGGIL